MSMVESVKNQHIPQYIGVLMLYILVKKVKLQKIKEIWVEKSLHNKSYKTQVGYMMQDSGSESKVQVQLQEHFGIKSQQKFSGVGDFFLGICRRQQVHQLYSNRGRIPWN